jgi:60 kDa SS-A/Ro ribonucleoprotein
MGPQALRMNLNTLERQGVFQDPPWSGKSPRGSRAPTKFGVHSQFPYQFLAAYLNAADDVPQAIKTALHRAAEHACGNMPVLSGPVIVGVDVSGSMQQAVTGNRGRGATSKMRCVDVAALVAARRSCGATRRASSCRSIRKRIRCGSIHRIRF